MSNPEDMQVDLHTTDTKEQIDHDIEMGEALIRLKSNPDFKKLILEGYLEQKVLASFSLLGIPQMQGNRGGIMEDMVAASNLKYWFAMIEDKYRGATDPILSDEEEAELNADQEGDA